MSSEAELITLHDLNDPETRRRVLDADIVLSVDPATGSQTIQAGRAELEATILANTASSYRVVRLSVEQDSGELEWAIGALVAIRGAARVDVDAEVSAGIRVLADVMRERWAAGRTLPTPGEIEDDEGPSRK